MTDDRESTSTSPDDVEGAEAARHDPDIRSGSVMDQLNAQAAAQNPNLDASVPDEDDAATTEDTAGTT